MISFACFGFIFSFGKASVALVIKTRSICVKLVYMYIAFDVAFFFVVVHGSPRLTDSL